MKTEIEKVDQLCYELLLGDTMYNCQLSSINFTLQSQFFFFKDKRKELQKSSTVIYILDILVFYFTKTFIT